MEEQDPQDEKPKEPVPEPPEPPKEGIARFACGLMLDDEEE